MHTKLYFACDICDAEYDNEAGALACEARGKPNLIVAVGDIVFGSAGFGWFDGDKKWVSNPTVSLKRKCPKGDGNCFDDCCTYRFYYVVSAIDVDPEDSHRPRYHLITGAMLKDYRVGYTFNTGHVTPRKVV
jgi:hypothetical protein